TMKASGLNEGDHVITVSATDSGGLRQTAAVNIRVVRMAPPLDGTPPTTIAVASPGANVHGWNDTDVNVSLSVADNPGGSGVQDIAVSLRGAQSGDRLFEG